MPTSASDRHRRARAMTKKRTGGDCRWALMSTRQQRVRCAKRIFRVILKKIRVGTRQTSRPDAYRVKAEESQRQELLEHECGEEHIPAGEGYSHRKCDE